MSGIFGIFNLDGRPVRRSDLAPMLATLERRGPDGSGMWIDGPVGLGHAMLRTTPESLHEQPPVVNRRGDLVITADVRLDNRDELISALGLQHYAGDTIGDNALILGAYEKWGEDCPARLLGDFAFAIWNKRKRTLFCARDQFGVRPFYYHHTDKYFFAFASEPKAILVLPQTPYCINEGRIADFLVTQLEGIDKTSTFFEEVYRLPPAHALIVTPQGMHMTRYWMLEPEPELRLSSDEEYAEAFLDVFTEAVRCRLRGPDGAVGSMLSGGMDSGSIVAVGRELYAKAGKGPFPTFSGVGPDAENCIETKTIYAALTMDGLGPHLVNYEQWDDLLPEMEELTWTLDEPFDNHMTLVRAVYLDAHHHGMKVMLDGIDGDTVLSEGSYITRLVRRGRWLTAYQEAVGQNRFWGGAYPPGRELLRSMVRAYAPEPVRRARRALHSPNGQTEAEKNICTSIINPDFAQRVDLAGRLQALAMHRSSGLMPQLSQERTEAVDHPYLTVGIERYNRVASAVGVEPGHPFLDRRLVAFSIALPGEQKLAQGWPKAILRRAMAGRLPDAVRWRRGKEHLGWSFTTALMGTMQTHMKVDIDENMSLISDYVQVDSVRKACRSYFDEDDMAQAGAVYEAAHLAIWLRRHADRPTIKT